MTSATTVIDSRSWWTLWLTSISVFMVSLEITVISLAFTEIGEAFPGSSRSTLSWVFTSYNIGIASLLLVSGWLADRHGRRLLFMTGLVLFGLASIGSGLAQSTEMLLTFRSLQSIGGAMLYPSSLALLLSAFPIERRQMAIGIWSAMGGLAAALGPSLGALLVDGFGWRSVFLINVPIAAVAFVLAGRKLEESKAEGVESSVDFIGVPLASIGVGALVLGITQVGQWGWGDARTIASFGAAVAFMALFTVRAGTHAAPLFDLKMLRIRSFSVGNLGALFFVAAFFGWLTLLPSFMQNVWQWSVLKSGFAIAPGPAITALLSPFVGRLADRTGHRPLLLFGAGMGAISLALMAALIETQPHYVSAVLPTLVIMGIAAAFSFAPLTGATMRDVSPAQFGMGGAARTAIFNLGIALGIAIAIAIIGTPASPQATVNGFRNTWIVGSVLFGAMFFTFLIGFENRTSAEVASSARIADNT